MEQPTRRQFVRHFGGALFSMLLFRALVREEAVAGPIRSAARDCLRDVERLSRGLKAGTIEPVEWQREVERVLGGVDLADLRRAIDYDRLARTAVLPDDHEFVEEVHLARRVRSSSVPSFSPYIHALERGRAIVPHGHRNMASMHMILRGEARVRHFDRVADEPQFLTIRETSDVVCRPGDVTTISDEGENVHWFVALGEPVFMFNVGVWEIAKGAAITGREYVDPAGGDRLSDGAIRAPKLDSESAYRKYGKNM